MILDKHGEAAVGQGWVRGFRGPITDVAPVCGGRTSARVDECPVDLEGCPRTTGLRSPLSRHPAAKAAVPETGEHILEAVEEHHVVAWLLSELLNMDAADESFNAKVTVMIENVRHHVKEEEKEWFPEVRRALGRNRLVALAEQMQAARAKAPADPLALKAAKA